MAAAAGNLLDFSHRLFGFVSVTGRAVSGLCQSLMLDLFDFSHRLSVSVSVTGRIVSDLGGLWGALKDGETNEVEITIHV